MTYSNVCFCINRIVNIYVPPPGSHESATTCNTRRRLAARVLSKYISLSEQADNTKHITYIASRLKPGNRATSRYSTGEVSTAIQLSGGGGASLKYGSCGARDLQTEVERAGGGSSIVGGAGGGSAGRGRCVDLMSEGCSDKGWPVRLEDASGGEYGGGGDSVWIDPDDEIGREETEDANISCCASGRD